MRLTSPIGQIGPIGGVIWPAIALLVAVLIGSVAGRFELSLLGLIGGLLFLFLLLGLTVRTPIVSFLLLLLVLPFERLPALEVGPLTVRMSTVIIPVLALGLAIHGLITKRLFLHRDPSHFFALVFVLATGVSAGFAWFHETRAVQYTLLTIFALGTFVLVSNLIRRTLDFRSVGLAVVSIATLLGLFGLYQFFGDLSGLPLELTLIKWGYHKAILGFPRIHTVSLEPLFYANFLLWPIGILLGRLLSRSQASSIFVSTGLILLLLFNFIFTLSRGGFVGLIVMLLVLGLIFFRPLFSSGRLAIAALIIITSGFLSVLVLRAVEPEALSRFVGHALIRSVNALKGESVTERAGFAAAALTDFKDHPIVGVGPGNFGPSVQQSRMTPPEGGWKVANNQYLETLAETGLIGTIPLALLLSLLWVRGLMAVRRARDEVSRGLGAGLLAAFSGHLVQWLTFSTIYSIPIWVMLGVLSGVSSVILEEKR